MLRPLFHAPDERTPNLVTNACYGIVHQKWIHCGTYDSKYGCKHRVMVLLLETARHKGETP